jgi:16S rRNA (guanine966-N2)-methyltransferase
MRIIAGSLKGRKLLTPEDDAIRPTSDRTRESVFNLLMHGQFGGKNIIGRRVADLCCGTGAVGLEAISRGAATGFFVDQSKKALELAKQNALHCNVLSQCQFIPADVTRLPPLQIPVELVFMDAPYAKDLLAPSYASLRQGGWLAPGTLLVVELPKHAKPAMPEGAELLDSRQYGKAAVHVYRCQ